ATGRRGADLGLIAGTRSFGHTFLFTAALAALARARRSKTLAALALGSATHLLLDLITDMSESGFDGHRLMSRSVKTLVWPLMGVQFPPALEGGLIHHLWRIQEPFILGAELAGAAFLIWERRRSRLAR
ncbi:MAG: hypothetical protein KGL74_05300, partial [Elusimicrobia bacterium]|nr:hypothetical protein [Elusimicrobiota bacterium]